MFISLPKKEISYFLQDDALFLSQNDANQCTYALRNNCVQPFGLEGEIEWLCGREISDATLMLLLRPLSRSARLSQDAM